MDLTGLAIYAAALFLAAASPGPGIAAIVARVLGRGPGGALAFTAGVAIGDVVWLTFAVAGLAVLAQTFHGIFIAVKWAGITYLLYLAWQMWTAPAVERAIEANTAPERPAALFLGGLAVTMGNPKVMVFYLALLPTLVDLAHLSWLGYFELVAATLAILGVVFASYVMLAVRARRLFTSARAMRSINRASACAMVGAATWVAVR